MLTQFLTTKNKTALLIIFLPVAMVSCNFPTRPSPSPTQVPTEEPIPQPTGTLDEDSAPSPMPTEEITPEPSSTTSEALSPELPGMCRPYPDQIFPVLLEGHLTDTIWIKCGTSSMPIPIGSPVEGLYWDYSNQMGKLVYGLEYEPGPEDLDVWIGDYSLWVYDYRTGLNTQ